MRLLRLPRRKRANVSVHHVDDSFGQGTLLISFDTVEKVKVERDVSKGKNLITVTINDETIFSYDSNFVGEYKMVNHIQKPLDEI